jgi:hypothetical protein
MARRIVFVADRKRDPSVGPRDDRVEDWLHSARKVSVEVGITGEGS